MSQWESFYLDYVVECMGIIWVIIAGNLYIIDQYENSRTVNRKIV